MIETTNSDLHKETWSTGEAISKQAVEKPEANQMEYTSLKSATKHLAENLQIHVFPVAEVIVRENNLKVLQTSCSLSWLFTSTTLLQREENEDREMEILYSGDEAFPSQCSCCLRLEQLHFLPIFPALIQGFLSPNMWKEKVESVWGC